MLLQIEVKRKMLGRSVTFEPRSVEKHFQQQNFFELTTPNAHLNLLMTFSLNVDFLASQKHRSYSRIFYPPNSAKLNKSFKILFTKDYGLLPYSKELLNIHYLLLLSTLPCPLFREFGEYLAPDRRAFATSVSRSGIF